MAVLQLQFDIDSEVHPELHAMLLATAAAGHGERLRQLAASGLVWERLRLQSHALAQQWVLEQALPGAGHAADAAASAEAPAASAADTATSAPLDAAVADAGADAVAATAPDASTAQTATNAAVALEPAFGDAPALPAAAPVPRQLHLEDTAGAQHGAAVGGALNGAAPAPDLALLLSLPPPDPTAAEMFLREMRNAVQELPVLTEVVDHNMLPRRAVASRERPGQGLGAMPQDQPQPAATPALAAAEEEPVPPAPLPRPATRSRLLRMQEKGLFRNE